jgi:thymidylate synthase
MLPHYEAETLDDLMRQAMTQAITEGERLNPTKGETMDLHGCVLELTNPRARLSRSSTRGRVFSALGELCWYLAGSNDLEFIRYYIPKYVESAEEDGTVHGAYGPRLLNFGGANQLRYIIDLLRENPASRKAVVQLFDRADVQSPFKDVPCTCTMQFLIRGGALQLIVYMRSNDMYKGLPHDIFCFTMIQELVARTLGVELGEYVHMAGSLHLYTSNLDHARLFLDEGWLSSDPVMPRMPQGDPWDNVATLLLAEKQLRLGQPVDRPGDPYWDDLVTLLDAYAHRSDAPALRGMRERFNDESFWRYLRERLDGLGGPAV